MDDYIKRKDAIQQMRRFIGYIGIDEDMCERFEIALNQILAADVASIRYGKWIDEKGEEVRFRENSPGQRFPEGSCWCSICGEYLVASDEYPVIGNYCPNCGAKMTHNK